MPPDLDTTWFDDDGELTELDSDESGDEEVAPPPQPRQSKVHAQPSPTSSRNKVTRASTQSATQKSRVRCGLKSDVRCLPAPRTTSYSASSLFDLIQDDLVDLNPEYQRGVVWNEGKQIALIGSLFQNYYVPPIVFTVKRDDDGREVRVCIDGKQRLTSIHRFMKGDIAYKDPSSNRKAYFASDKEKTKKKLITDILRSNFKNKQIICVEYEGLTGEEEREIFQRVQLGVSLAPADRLPAINGPYANLVRDLRAQIEHTQGFQLYLNWGAARGRDFQALAQIVYLINFGNIPSKAEPTAMRLEAFLNNQTDTGLKALTETAANVMDIFCRIAYDQMLGAPIRKDLSPLEFVMACYLVYVHRKRLSDAQLSDAMGRMRAEYAQSCGDRKTSQKNFKFLLNFVLKEVSKLKDLKRMPGEMVAVHACSAEGMPMDCIKTDPSQTQTVKRKRAGSEASDNDYIARPKKRTTRPVQKVEAMQTPPPESTSAPHAMKMEAAASASAPTRARVPPAARASMAKTVVKRTPSKTNQMAEKTTSKVVGTQVATPTVRPPASAKTQMHPSYPNPNAHAAAGASAYPSAASASSSAPRKPSLTLSASGSSAPASTPRPPLPSRIQPMLGQTHARTTSASSSATTSSHNASSSSSTRAPSGLSTAGAPVPAPVRQAVAPHAPAQPHATEVSSASVPPHALPTTTDPALPHTRAPALRVSTGGPAASLDRPAPLRTAHGAAPAVTPTVGAGAGAVVGGLGAGLGGKGSFSGVAGGVASGSGSGGNSGQGTSEACPSTRAAKTQRQLPKFTRLQAGAQPEEQWDETWDAEFKDALGGQLALDPMGGALPQSHIQTQALAATQMQQVRFRMRTSSVLATPTPSPHIPHTVPTTQWWPPPPTSAAEVGASFVPEQPTRDPRIAARDKELQRRQQQQQQPQQQRQPQRQPQQRQPEYQQQQAQRLPTPPLSAPLNRSRQW